MDRNISRRERWIRTLLVLCAPFAAVSFLLLVLIFAPLPVPLVVEFQVVNRSGERINFTPVGNWEGGSPRGVLNQLMSRNWSTPPLHIGHFWLEPGESRTVFFDWGDINFTEIAVEDRAGHVYQIAVVDDPVSEVFMTSTPEVFAIPALSELGPASPEVLDAHRRAAGISRAWIVFLPILVIPILLFGVLFTLFLASGSNARRSGGSASEGQLG